MGREGDSRGTTQVSHQTVRRFAPTNISLSYNVEITVHTTNVTPDTSSHERLKRELQLISVECNSIACFAHLWRLLPAYFPLSLPLFNWTRLLPIIICKNGTMSRLGFVQAQAAVPGGIVRVTPAPRTAQEAWYVKAGIRLGLLRQACVKSEASVRLFDEAIGVVDPFAVDKTVEDA
jgi:hypothetical protein